MKNYYYFTLLIGVLFCSCAKEDDTLAKAGGKVPEGYVIDQTTTLIGIDEALDNVASLLASLDTPETRSGRPVRKIKDYFVVGQSFATRSTLPQEDEIAENDPIIYIFNFENDEGFAIVPGDRRAPSSVFAITEKGYLDPDVPVDNPGLALFLGAMEERYIEALAAGITFPPFDGSGPAEKDLDDRRYITFGWQYIYPPHMSSGCVWGQRDPYNMFAPIKDSNAWDPKFQRAPAGCTATAVAQLMACWQWPEVYSGDVYLWNEMVKHQDSYEYYGVKYKPVYYTIGRFFEKISIPVNLNVQFGASGSPASQYNIPQTFYNMGYGNKGYIQNFNWPNAVRELQSGYPLIMVGWSFKVGNSYERGHAWTVEKLMKRWRTVKVYNSDNVLISSTEEWEDYFYCNFGWDGDYNGYYYPKAFDTTQGPDITRSDKEGYYRYNFQTCMGIRK